MKKYMGILAILVVAIFLGGCGADDSKELSQLEAIVENNQESMGIPERSPEINGTVVSVEGNKIIVKNEIGREILTPEDQAKRRAERQKMTQEERQALRAQETTSLETEDVKVIIPVGTVIVKGSGAGDGESVKATFDDIKSGAYISVWKSGDTIEAVKVKGA